MTPATINRESIQAALFALLTLDGAVLPTIRLASRRLKPPQEIGAGNCPALFQVYKGETVEWTGERPLRRTLHLELVLYAHSGDKSLPASATLGPLIDAVEQAFGACDPASVQTLGGLVHRVTINGKIETDEGLLGEYAFAIVPVDILVP